MKFVSTLTPNFQYWSDEFYVKLCKVVSYAKLSWRKYGNLYIDLGLPVRAVRASILLNVYTALSAVCLLAEEAEAYCESPFCLLQEEVRALQYFMFQACNCKPDRKEYITGFISAVLGFWNIP